MRMEFYGCLAGKWPKQVRPVCAINLRTTLLRLPWEIKKESSSCSVLSGENRRHLATPPLVFPRHGVWGTSAEIPYWWRVTTQIWVVLLIGWSKLPSRHDQSEALPRSGYWRVISMEFLSSFLRRHFAGKPMVTTRNVGCLLRLVMYFYSRHLNEPTRVVSGSF